MRATRGKPARGRGGLLTTLRRLSHPAWPDQPAPDPAPALDWPGIQDRLEPVRRTWDLAILCNLREDEGRRPGDLLERIRGQARPGRELGPEVLSGRLRRLEQDGYVCHEEITRLPLRREYRLLPRGRQVLEDLRGLPPAPEVTADGGRAR